jgi:hypothetical protein
MTALTVLIIRHAEKPGEAWAGPGLTQLGEVNKKSLVLRGWERAGAWAALFGGGHGGADYPTPNHIYAANPNVEGSRRAHETIIPLAARLGFPPVTRFAVGEEAAMAAEVAHLAGVVLISWEHKRIGEALLPELTRGQAGPALPVRWESARYDVVLRLDRAAPGALWRVRQLFPRLLSGDSAQPMV